MLAPFGDDMRAYGREAAHGALAPGVEQIRDGFAAVRVAWAR